MLQECCWKLSQNLTLKLLHCFYTNLECSKLKQIREKKTFKKSSSSSLPPPQFLLLVVVVFKKKPLEHFSWKMLILCEQKGPRKCQSYSLRYEICKPHSHEVQCLKQGQYMSDCRKTHLIFWLKIKVFWLGNLVPRCVQLAVRSLKYAPDPLGELHEPFS